MPKIWFIRHGESISNANLPTTHPAQSELTAVGEQESRLIANAFTQKPDLIVASSMVRAQQTAAPTIARFYPIAQEEWAVHEFTYLAPDRYAGTTLDDRRPFAREYWERSDPFYKDGDVGESFAELMGRVSEAIARGHRYAASFIVVFSHGLFLGALFWSLLTGITEATPETMRQYSFFVRSVKFPNASILKTTFDGNGRVHFTAGFDTVHLLETSNR